MLLFFQIVGGFFVALILLILIAYVVIRWKIKRWFSNLADSMMGMAGGVPPFRIKLRKKSEIDDEFDDDDDEEEEFGDNAAKIKSLADELKALGFEKIDDYVIEEIGTEMPAFVHRERGTYCVIYNHPFAGVWCDVVRMYADGTSWTYANNEYHGMDEPPGKTSQWFPKESLTELVRKFWDDSPSDGTVVVPNEEFAATFEKKYAQEMDWRIERGGVTEAEIRRIAEKGDDECTPEHVKLVQDQWRMSITQFHCERILRRFRKETDMPRREWEEFQYEAVVVHEKMQADEILTRFDEGYYPMEPDEEEDDDLEERAEQKKWAGQLSRIEHWLKEGISPQECFRNLVEAEKDGGKWEHKGIVEKPLRAEIWLRKWEADEAEDDFYDDEDDYDED